MDESKDVKDVVENEVSYGFMVYIYADNVSEKKQRKWVSKNTIN